jgi:hypothetical protein
VRGQFVGAGEAAVGPDAELVAAVVDQGAQQCRTGSLAAGRGGDDELGGSVGAEGGVADQVAGGGGQAGDVQGSGLTGVREDVQVAVVLAVEVEQRLLRQRVDVVALRGQASEFGDGGRGGRGQR